MKPEPERSGIAMDMGLTGRTVLVTGAGTNVGRAVAHAFGAEGAQVAGCSKTNISALTSAAESLRSAGVVKRAWFDGDIETRKAETEDGCTEEVPRRVA